MVKVHLELEGEVAEVSWAMRRIVGGAPDVAWSPAGPQTAAAERRPADTPTVPEREIATTSAELPPGHWTCGGRAKGVSTAMYFANGPT